MSHIDIQVQQGSEAWFQARCGAITASMFSEVRKRLKSGPNKGGFSKAAQDYAFKLAVERISGTTMEEPQFDPWQARRGRELEPEARLAYEERREVIVEETGLAITDDNLFGASVDGLVGSDGIVEIKCFLAPSKVKAILLDGDTSELDDQMQGALWITGRQWCDAVLYVPALEGIGCHLTIIRTERDETAIDALSADLLSFNTLVERYRTAIQEKAA